MIQNIYGDERNPAGVLCENRAGRDLRGFERSNGMR
jgi:hypothetical protein